MTINQKIIDGRLVEFFGRFSEIKYAKKEYILRAEDEPQGIYFLKSGFVKQVFLTESGKCLTLNIFKPGTYFPLTWALGGVENHDFFEAMTAVVTYRAPNDQVLAWLKQILCAVLWERKSQKLWNRRRNHLWTERPNGMSTEGRRNEFGI